MHNYSASEFTVKFEYIGLFIGLSHASSLLMESLKDYGLIDRHYRFDDRDENAITRNAEHWFIDEQISISLSWPAEILHLLSVSVINLIGLIDDSV